LLTPFGIVTRTSSPISKLATRCSLRGTPPPRQRRGSIAEPCGNRVAAALVSPPLLESKK